MKLNALLIFLLLPTFANSMDNVSKIMKPLGILAASWIVSLISHEMGHALSTKLLFNSPINIHLGHQLNLSCNKEDAYFNVGLFIFTAYLCLVYLKVGIQPDQKQKMKRC